jgi:hypothetical protein
MVPMPMLMLLLMMMMLMMLMMLPQCEAPKIHPPSSPLRSRRLHAALWQQSRDREARRAGTQCRHCRLLAQALSQPLETWNARDK